MHCTVIGTIAVNSFSDNDNGFGKNCKEVKAITKKLIKMIMLCFMITAAQLQ